MKNILLLASLLILFVIANAEVPQSMNYQTVVRDASGNALINKDISFRFTILNSFSGSIEYVETDSVITNDFGLATVVIGKGTVVSGSIAAIDWNSSYQQYLKVELDAAGGTNYTDMGMSQLQSVPYALQAGSSANVNGDTNYVAKFTNKHNIGSSHIYDNGTTVAIGTAAPAASAALEINSTTGALLLPRLTTSQRDALSAVPGMVIYNTNTFKFQGFTNGGASVTTGPSITDTSVSNNFGACQLASQTFMAENTGALNKIRVYAFASGGPNPIRYRLRTGSTPGTGTLLDSVDVTVPNVRGWIDLVFPAHPMMYAGQGFQLEINADRSATHCTWMYTSDTPYVTGDLYLYDDFPMSAWNTFGSHDLVFQVIQDSNVPNGWVDLH